MSDIVRPMQAMDIDRVYELEKPASARRGRVIRLRGN